VHKLHLEVLDLLPTAKRPIPVADCALLRCARSGAVGGDAFVSGKIAGGGCELKLTDQNGNIDIVK
jgi:hypothetical protein